MVKPLAPSEQTAASEASRPNIVFIYLDDQGFNDMGPASTDYADLTPNVDLVAAEGLWLTSYYGQEACTPSRAALLTGIYPVHTGMQYGILTSNDPWGLPTEYKLLPEYLKAAGNYTTHLVGKWHLGHFAKTRLPQQRGFDTFFGYYSGFTSYFSHVSEITLCDSDSAGCWYDLHNQEEPVRAAGVYNQDMFAKQVHDLIDAHGALLNASQSAGSGSGSGGGGSSSSNPEQQQQQQDEARPMFLYYAMGVVHAPLQCPEAQLEKNAGRLAHIPNAQRRVHACMTTVLDDGVGDVVDALKTNGLYDDTLLVIASDNGANPQVDGGGSNWPLRGKKGDFFEGGVRVHAVLRSAAVPAHLRGGTYGGLFHVTDWLPTILLGVLGAPDTLKPVGGTIDGVNHWRSMVTGKADAYPRTNLVHSISPVFFTSPNGTISSYMTGAIRHGDYKLIVNAAYAPSWSVPTTPTIGDGSTLGDTVQALLDQTPYQKQNFLFNIADDPTELVDLKDTSSEIYDYMLKAFTALSARAKAPEYCGVDDTADAEAVFEVSHFLGPWRKDDVQTKAECLSLGSELGIKHTLKTTCMYSLGSEEDCEAMI